MRSYPSCAVKGNVLDETLAWLEEVEGAPHPAIRPALAAVRPAGRAAEWVPEVLVNAVSLQVADHGFPSGDSWLREVYRRQRQVYGTPLYRAIMLVLSPTLMTMGAQDRWKAYRRGTELAVEKWRNTARGRETIGLLRHPPGLYAELNVLSLGQAIVAAMDACGAKGSTIELVSMDDEDGSRFRLTYDA